VAQWKKIITSGSNATLNDITVSNNISANGNITGVNIIGTASANTSVLEQSLTASLNTSVGTIDNGESFPAGTSIEAILRSMLIDFIAPTITSFNITDLPSEMEAGDSITVTAGTFATSSDSNGEGFTGGIKLKLTNNQSNTVNNFTVTSGTTLDFDDILVSQSEAKQVIFKLEATNSQADVVTENDTCNFRSPIFYGGSSNTGGGLDTTVLSSVLADISSSITNTTNTSQIKAFNSSTETFGTQTYFNTTSTTILPSDTKISLPGSVENSNNFTYIIYPSSYGELSQVLKNGVQNETGTFSLLGAVNHTRYTTIEYNVYRTVGQNAFESGDVLTLND
jgi:hypothetical protein